MRPAIRRKWRRLTGWACFFGWLAFGASCGGSGQNRGDAALRTMLDIIEMVCPPEITVGDCAARVKAWLPQESKALAPADAGSD